MKNAFVLCFYIYVSCQNTDDFLYSMFSIHFDGHELLFEADDAYKQIKW